MALWFLFVRKLLWKKGDKVGRHVTLCNSSKGEALKRRFKVTQFKKKMIFKWQDVIQIQKENSNTYNKPDDGDDIQ